MVAFRQYGHSHPKIVFIHLTIKCNTKGRFADVSHNIARLDSTISLKLQESNFLLYATRFSIMRSLVKRLGMGLPNNLLPEFPAITGSLIDRSIDLLLTFLKICLAAHAIAH
jgi:hypothetical protein